MHTASLQLYRLILVHKFGEYQLVVANIMMPAVRRIIENITEGNGYYCNVSVVILNTFLSYYRPTKVIVIFI